MPRFRRIDADAGLRHRDAGNATLRHVSEERSPHDDVRSAWDELAVFWDERMEAGATWQRHLIQPSVERLLRLEPGERVLEIACGNGEFARRMSELGGQVLATDFSEAMLERARAHGGDVEYRYADATDKGALLALGEPASFDAVVSNMAIIDMESIEPMAAACSRLLSRPAASSSRRCIPRSTRAT
jgi:ubiquinone/menaquinone biosynthesis C-methylase UbiE